MKTEDIKNLFNKFESVACEYQGVECWSARELCGLLGYAKWERFEGVIARAKEACENAGVNPSDHFPSVGKMVELGSGSVREVADYMLTRYACYLVAQNGDPRKPEISFAQNYFAVQTRVAEMVERRVLEYERVKARHKLAETEKQLSGVLYERGVDEKGLYGYTNNAVVQEPSVTISARGNVGTCFLRRQPYSGIVRLVSVIPNNAEMLYYLFYDLSSRNMQGDGSAQAQITVPQLQNEQIIIPKKAILRRFCEQAKVIYDNIDCIEKELHHLRTLQSLLTSKLAY